MHIRYVGPIVECWTVLYFSFFYGLAFFFFYLLTVEASDRDVETVANDRN